MRNSFSLFHLLFPTTAKFPSFHSSPFFFIISSPNFRGVSKGRRLRKEEEEVQKMYVKEDKEFARHLLFFLLISSYTNIIKRWGLNLLKANSFSKKKIMKKAWANSNVHWVNFDREVRADCFHTKSGYLRFF